MLIIYDTDTHEVLSFAGIRGDVTDLELERLEIPELPAGKGAFKLTDRTKMNQVWQALDAADGIELVFEGGTPVGVQIIDLPEPDTGA